MSSEAPAPSDPTPIDENTRLAHAVADLRRDAPPLDDLSRARMERGLIDAMARGVKTGGVSLPTPTSVGSLLSSRPPPPFEPSARSGRSSRGLTMGWVAIKGLVAMAAAVAITIVTLQSGFGARGRVAEGGSGQGVAGDEAGPESLSGEAVSAESAQRVSDQNVVARFEVSDDHATTQRGTLDEGSMLTTGADERSAVSFGDSRVELRDNSQLRIATLTSERLVFELRRGSVHVAFHPENRGQQQLVVRTFNARVEVVGTEFSVRARSDETLVTVVEGVVRVVPTGAEASPDRAHLVRAGERTTVSAVRSQASEGADERSPRTRSSPRVAVRRAPSPHEDFERANTLLRGGDREGAVSALRELTGPERSSVVQARAWHRIGLIRRTEGQYARAAEAFERALRAAPRRPAGTMAVFELGWMYESRMGDRASAQREYERYLRIAPQGAHANRARERLCAFGDRTSCRADDDGLSP